MTSTTASKKRQCPDCHKLVCKLKRHMRSGCTPIACQRCGLAISVRNKNEHDASCVQHYDGAKFSGMYRLHLCPTKKRYESVLQCRICGKLMLKHCWSDHVNSKTHEQAIKKGEMAIELLDKKNQEYKNEMERQYGKGEQRKHGIFYSDN